jgi:ketosteroid isomerase-like protein
VLVHRQPAIAGQAAVRDAFGEVFAAFDTSDYESRYDTIEVHVDSAYVMGDIVEGLRPQDGGSGIRVYVRVVLFFRRIDLSWVITRLLTGRFAPDEPLP